MIWPSTNRGENVGLPGYWVDDDNVISHGRTTVFDPRWDVPVGIVHRNHESAANIVNRARDRVPSRANRILSTYLPPKRKTSP